MSFAKKDRNISLGVYLMIFLALFLSLFVFYIVASNQKLFDSKYKLYMHLPNAQGLNSGAFVTLSGLKVGVVGKMKIVNNPDQQGVKIELKIDKDYQESITLSSMAMIKTLGILGDKYVDITIGAPGEPPLESGAYIKSDAGLDPYEFMDEAAEIIVELRNVLKNTDSLTAVALKGHSALGQFMVDPDMGQQLGDAVKNLAALTRQIRRGDGTIGKLVSDTTLYANLQHSSANLNELLDSLNHGKGTFAQVKNDPQFYQTVKSLAANTDSLFYKMQHKGSMAAFLNDPDLYNSLVSLTRSLDSLTTDMKKRPGRYVKFELF